MFLCVSKVNGTQGACLFYLQQTNERVAKRVFWLKRLNMFCKVYQVLIIIFYSQSIWIKTLSTTGNSAQRWNSVYSRTLQTGSLSSIGNQEETHCYSYCMSRIIRGWKRNTNGKYRATDKTSLAKWEAEREWGRRHSTSPVAGVGAWKMCCRFRLEARLGLPTCKGHVLEDTRTVT